MKCLSGNTMPGAAEQGRRVCACVGVRVCQCVQERARPGEGGRAVPAPPARPPNRAGIFRTWIFSYQEHNVFLKRSIKAKRKSRVKKDTNYTCQVYIFYFRIV